MRVFIGDIELDRDRDTSVALNLTADSLESVESIQSSYSYEVDFPLTQHNINILGNLQALESGSEYVAPNCYVRDIAGSQVISNGLFIINRLEGTRLYANIFEGSVNLLDLLEGLTLQDLGADAFGTAIERTEANIAANLANVNTDGFTYATFNNGNYTGGAYAIEQLFPAPFVWQILKAICSKAGYTLDDATGLMADTAFQRWILPFNGERYNPDAQFYDDARGFSVTAGALPAGTYTRIGSNVGGGGATILENDSFVPALGFEVPDGNKVYFFEGRLDQDITTNAGAYEFNLRIRNRTQGVTLASYSSGAVTGAGSTVSDSRILQSGLLDNLNTGDLITFEIDAVTGLNFAAKNPTYFRNDDGRYSDATIYATNLYQDPPTGQVLDPITLVPNMPIVDFLKGVLNMACSRLDTDNVRQTVTIRRFKDYSRDISAPFDISEKVDSNGIIEKEFVFGDYSQVNTFLYDNEDTINEGFASGAINITNDNLSPEPRELIKLPFSASLSTLDGLSIPIAELGSDDIVNELKPRIAIVSSVSQNITVGATVVNPYNRMSFQPLSWAYVANSAGNPIDAGLLVDYWAEFALVIQKMEKTTLRILMNAVDFAQLDFFNLVYLRWSNSFYSFNGFYLLQLVDGYTGNGLAEVELIRVNFT